MSVKGQHQIRAHGDLMHTHLQADSFVAWGGPVNKYGSWPAGFLPLTARTCLSLEEDLEDVHYT